MDAARYNGTTECTDWNLHIFCVSHTTQSAIQWPLKPWGDAALQKESHNTIRTLRNNADDLRRQVDRFLMQAVAFTRKTDDIDQVRLFWEFLDVPPRIRGLMVMVDPIFENGRLHVNQALEGLPNALRRVKVCVLHCCRWLDWSDTRWLRSGRCARYFLRSALVGVDYLVDLCLADTTCSHYFLKCFDKATFSVRRFFAVAAVASLPAEAVHCKIMADDRFLKFGAANRAEISGQLDRIASFPSLLWQRLNLALKGTNDWRELRSWCQQGAATCSGYLHRETFGILHAEPFCLTQGNVRANLQRLSERSLDDIRDETMRNILRLQIMGLSPVR